MTWNRDAASKLSKQVDALQEVIRSDNPHLNNLMVVFEHYY